MSADHVGFFGRLILAFLLPFRVLFDGRLAARINGLDGGAGGAEALPAPSSPAPAPARSTAAGPSADDGAVHLLSLLQRDGRLVDFLVEDVSAYSDREIGGAVRSVHEGCSKTLAQYLEIVPIRDEDEGASITLDAGFDASAVRLVGNVTGEPPYTGTLAHPGWRVASLNLPERSGDEGTRVLSPAEVEL
jgi:hypothetical protein